MKNSEPKKENNIIDSIVQKHINKRTQKNNESSQEKKVLVEGAFKAKNNKEKQKEIDISPIVYQYNEPKKKEEKKEGSSGVKSGSLVSFEYNRPSSKNNVYNRESSNRNESYEIMELNSFNEVKKSEQSEEEKFNDGGLYGVFDRVLENQKNFYEEGSMRNHSINDLQDSMNEESK